MVEVDAKQLVLVLSEMDALKQSLKGLPNADFHGRVTHSRLQQARMLAERLSNSLGIPHGDAASRMPDTLNNFASNFDIVLHLDQWQTRANDARPDIVGKPNGLE
jgi:hypothetical protein